MDEIEFAEHKIKASKTLTDSDSFLLVTIRDGSFTGNVQHSTAVQGMAMANYLRLYAREIEDNLFNDSDEE